MNRVVLIPAAGFGRRVGTQDAKELLPRPSTNEPMIDQPIKEALEARALPHVIVREGKNNLKEHLAQLNSQGYTVSQQEIVASREWPDTILQSQPHWKEHNLIYLPDLHFRPRIIDSIFADLSEFELVVAGCFVNDASNWGVVDRENTAGYRFCEKPRNIKRAWAWGFIGFRKNRGAALLENLLETTFDHRWKSLSLKARFLDLVEMRDLTRG